MTILLDKWFDGDPSNNDFFKTKFEHDAKETQLRFGGDIKGLTNNRTLDYLHGMGIRAIYIAGTPWLNMPWQADSKLHWKRCCNKSDSIAISSQVIRHWTLLFWIPISVHCRTGEISLTPCTQRECTTLRISLLEPWVI